MDRESLFVEDDETYDDEKDLGSNDTGAAGGAEGTTLDDGSLSASANTNSAVAPSATAPSATLSLLLEFHQTIVKEILAQDGLLLMARGLGTAAIAVNIIYALDKAGYPQKRRDEVAQSLVLVVGARDHENVQLQQSLRELAVLEGMWDLNMDGDSAEIFSPSRRGLTVVNTEVISLDRRKSMYSVGGVFSVTSRILVVDLLSSIIDVTKISGIVVLHAERVTATSSEAFILRLFREKNRTGFIKAISDEPESFSFQSGFASLAAMMKNLRVPKVFLWPRFHVKVTTCLEHMAKQALRLNNDIKSVVELEVQMSPAMRQIQTAIMECIEACISELKKHNSELDTDSWSLDNALLHNFDAIIRAQLEPQWHRISFRTKQIAQDLSTLRQLLRELLVYDCVTFYQTLESIHLANAPAPGASRKTQSPWLFLDAADTLFVTAKSRIFGDISTNIRSNKAGKARKEPPDGQEDPGLRTKPSNSFAHLEEQPKWDQLAKILKEIHHERNVSGLKADGPVLIMCIERKTCNQLQQYLSSMREESQEGSSFTFFSGQRMMRRKLKRYLEWKEDLAAVRRGLNHASVKPVVDNTIPVISPAPSNGYSFKRRRVRGGSSVAAVPDRKASSTVEEFVQINDDPEIPQEDNASEDDDHIEVSGVNIIDDENDGSFEAEFVNMKDAVIIRHYDPQTDDSTLEELSPSFVILYEPEISFVRRIELYRASHIGQSIKVYFMYYGDSVEEQRYLDTVRREKDAFTKLIKERASMPIILTTEEDELSNFLPNMRLIGNTRIAGGMTVSTEKPQVIVDVREIRSSLPSLLHQNHMIVIPVTLTVGDYILTPKICVERKSVPDLISSFKDGRLYTQCEAMFRYYELPTLLIEFDQSKSFSLEPVSDAPGGGAQGSLTSAETARLIQENIQSKLTLLLLNFPKLKIIWSSSPYQTAEIFEILKQNQSEPDMETCVNNGSKDDPESSKLQNHTAIDMLRTIPGIDAKNYKLVVNQVRDLQEFCRLSETELAEIIGREAAKKAHDFIVHNLRRR